MNLWGRLAGYTFLAFFFLISCREDETNLLGFKKTSDKFKVRYVEVEVPTSVMAIDSVLTYNDIILSAKRRLMVGRYVDNKFGEITSEAYTQFGPVQPTVSISNDAKLVSGSLTLSFDFYYYGDDQISPADFTVHELLDSIPPVFLPSQELPRSIQGVQNYQPYYYNSSIPYENKEIGSATYNVSPSIFNLRAETIRSNPSSLDHKTIDSLSIPLNSSFTNKLFAMARAQTNDYKVFSRFRRNFKGLAIKPGLTGSKIIGFNPDIDSTKFAKSKIVLYYDDLDATGSTVRRKLEYSLFALPNSSQLFGFTNISADRSGSPLAALPGPDVESELDGNRYYQSGNPVTTKLRFDEFLNFTDTIPNLLFNSVELSIDVEDAETFAPPLALRLRYLNSSNNFVNFFSAIPGDATTPLYPSMTYDEQGWFIIGQRFDASNVGTAYDLLYNASAKQYLGDLTNFFQSLYDIKDEAFRYTEFALVAASPPIGLSVNRTFFNKDKIKLKMIYTVPVINK